MKKIAWPWIGSTPHEMGSGSQNGDFTDKEEGSHLRPNMLVPGYSVVEMQDTGINHENGITSPVEDVSFVDDSEDKASVEISDEDDDVVANFSCDVANSFQDKVSGLQTYNKLKSSAGLIFPYKRAEDVVYHMGTVSFPIDIIFADDNDIIKKIYKNIKPGTLGTFGCAGVKNVLEISGGLSDRLGIAKGQRISISKGKDSELSSVSKLNKLAKRLGIEKKIIIKYSEISSERFSNWKGFPILSINNSIIKTANETKLLSSLIESFIYKSDSRKIYAFDFDGLIEASPIVRVYKTSELVEDEVPYIRIDGHTVSIDKTSEGNDIYRDVHLYELMDKGINNDESILESLNKSFAYFMNNDKILKDATKIFNEIRKASHDSDARVIIVTRSPNPEYLKSMVCSRINLQFGDRIDSEVLSISKESDAEDVLFGIRKLCGNKDISLFSDRSLLKRAGSPVPNSVKEQAKRIYKLLDSASESAELSLENMKKNVIEYDKIKDDVNAIRSSKGQYNQSVKRNTRVVKDYLIKIRDSIKIFIEIKDISTTVTIIDGLVESTKIASDSVEGIFDLIDELESPEFHMILTEKVNEYERTIEDLISIIDRGREYINSDILGLVVLSS
jgi:uncharacterized membrane protein (UPF0127 family)